jgi:hypothetical protein
VAKWSFNQEIKDALDSFLLENLEVEPGKAFGLPVYYINGKMFAGVYEDGATMKVPPDLATELLRREDVFEFRPMDKHAMKNWVLIKKEDPRDYLEDKALFETAMEHVYMLSKEKKK